MIDYDKMKLNHNDILFGIKNNEILPNKCACLCSIQITGKR